MGLFVGRRPSHGRQGRHAAHGCRTAAAIGTRSTTAGWAPRMKPILNLGEAPLAQSPGGHACFCQSADTRDRADDRGRGTSGSAIQRGRAGQVGVPRSTNHHGSRTRCCIILEGRGYVPVRTRTAIRSGQARCSARRRAGRYSAPDHQHRHHAAALLSRISDHVAGRRRAKPGILR